MSSTPSTSSSRTARPSYAQTISTTGADRASSGLGSTSSSSGLPTTHSSLSLHTVHSDLSPASLPARPSLPDRAFSSATVASPHDARASAGASAVHYATVTASTSTSRPRATMTVNPLSNHPHHPIHRRPHLRHRGTESRAAKLMRVVSERVSRGSDAAPAEEWTVFGQRMEDEGQLAPSSILDTGSSLRRSGAGLSVRSLRQTLSRHSLRSSTMTGRKSPPVDMFPEIVDVASPQVETAGGANPFESSFRAGGSGGGGGSSTEEGSGIYDSDDEGSGSSREQTAEAQARGREWWKAPKMPTIPLLWRNILKCAVAYFIGSLFTFSPYLSRFITDVTSSGEKRPSPSGHMVATVAVYFNPAKTAGGMIEADIFCLLGLFWAAFVSLGSMASFWFFEVRRGWEWLADALGLLWVGVGMSLMAFAKVKMAKPSFNPACSMAAIILFVVVVKEGGLQTLFQVSVIVFTGTVVANVVCFCLWPQSATAQLQANMVGTLDSFATLLRMITAAFLLEGAPGDGERLKRAVESHERSFTVLKKNLGEARREVGGPGTAGKRGEERGKRQVLGRAYEDAVDCLNRLGQHLNGLRGGTTLQYELTKALRDGRLRPEGAPEVKGKVPGGEGDDKGAPPTTEEEAMLRAAAIMFGDLIDDLGPPLKALSSTCVGSLKELREAFLRVSDRDGAAFRARTFQELDASIKRALYTFESTSNHALMRLYQKSVQSDYAGAHAEQHRARESVASFTGVGNESENLFLVYFFIFTLQEFAGELLALVDAVGRIYEVEREAMMRGPWWKRMFTGPWQRVRELFRRSEARGHRRVARKKGQGSLRRPLSSFILPGSGVRQIAFPKVRPHAPNTKQTPARADLPFWGRVKQAVWAAGSRLRENDAKYGVKTGLATAMLAAPAFFEATRPVFLEYRGEWALISFFVVMSPTIGATNNLSIHRVLGTIFGAATAAGIWTLFPENAVVLSIFGFFYSIPCFYIIVAKPALATTGRFLLLTYNLTCLFCYNLRQRDVSVIDIAVHRSTAVIVGVLWAFLVSRFWWPTEARRELSKKLGDFCLNLGWLYTRLVAHNSFATDPPRVTNGEDDNDDDDDDHPTEETSLLARKTAATKLNNSISEFMAMELHLQIQLIEMQGLLAQTAHEPRLKGPFPIQLYRNILTSLQTILDKLHSMRCVTTREEWFTSIRRDFIVPVNKERREMVGNIILYLSVLSSTFRLKAPLPPYLPPAAQSQERLVDAIRELEVVKNREVKGSRQLLFFAYALTMKGVIHELDYLGKTLQDAFGVIGQTTEEFEAMFRERPASEIQDSV